MTLPLQGRTVALAEGRQIEELADMLETEGATVLRCPMVSILDAPDPAPVVAWLRELISGRFAYVILLTGEGVRRLLGFADRVNLRGAAVAALARARTITRGPKPVRALKEGKSLLPAGIRQIDGRFERGDAVVVKDRDGREVARGLAAYNASDAERIAGKRTVEIEAILGYRGRDEMIHRDDLVLTGNGL